MPAEHKTPTGYAQGYYCLRCGASVNMIGTGHGPGLCEENPERVAVLKDLNSVENVTKDYIWRVTWLESDSWSGQKYFDVEYDTKPEADAAIAKANEDRAKWWTTHTETPEYYITPWSVPVYEKSKKT